MNADEQPYDGPPFVEDESEKREDVPPAPEPDEEPSHQGPSDEPDT